MFRNWILFGRGRRSDDGHPPFDTRVRVNVRRGVTAGRAVTLFFGGSHPEEVARLPRAELRSLRTDGAILMASIVFNFTVWTSAMIAAEKPWWAAVPVGVLVTTIIGLLDRQVLSSLISHEGEQIATRFGVPGFMPVHPRRRWFLTGGRILLSVASMAAAMMLLRTSLFAPDIEAHLQRQNAEINRVVRQRSERMVDARLGELRSRLTKATAERDELRGRLSTAETPLNTNGIDTQIAAERQALDGANAQYRALVQQFFEAKRAAAAEKTGVKDREGDSGNDGEGERYRYHQERQAQIRQQAGIVAATIRATQQRIQSLTAEKAGALDQQRNGARDGVSSLTPRIKGADGVVAALAAQRLAGERGRAAAIDEGMRSDPGYTPLRTGLIARVDALGEVENGSWPVRFLSFAIGIAASVLELAVVLFRALLGTPGPVGFLRLHANVALIESLINAAPAADVAEVAPVGNDNAPPLLTNRGAA